MGRGTVGAGDGLPPTLLRRLCTVGIKKHSGTPGLQKGFDRQK